MAVESFVQTYNQRDAQAAAPGREVVALSATPSGGSCGWLLTHLGPGFMRPYRWAAYAGGGRNHERPAD